METMIKSIASLALSAVCTVTAVAQSVTADEVDIKLTGDYLTVNADIVLDNLKLRSNQQIFITPIVQTAELSADSLSAPRNTLELPSILVSGKNMHVCYERGVLRNFKEIKSHDIAQEVRRYNGSRQSVAYSYRVPAQNWMRDLGANVVFVYDSCGCGAQLARRISDPVVLFRNPVREMYSIMIIPEIEEIPVQIHEGRARVQFEVDRTELHVTPYTCRNGQRIDNREQIQMIDDSVRYALSDPNVEISAIELCGYASPESPYLHNMELADGRTKALAQYIAQRYSLPQEKVTYSSVPENWVEFREMVVNSDLLTDQERSKLLQLIDEPAFTPEEWDHKEWILKTEKPYADLYRSFILPEWFPKLRATTFAVHTRLKNLSDEELKDVIRKTPEKMSLNQMYRVARMYPEDSDEFNEVMQTALKYYPRDQIAITNAATAAIAREDYDRAKKLLARVPENTPAVYNLLGIIATAEGKYQEAERYFDMAEGNANAKRNKEMLK